MHNYFVIDNVFTTLFFYDISRLDSLSMCHSCSSSGGSIGDSSGSSIRSGIGSTIGSSIGSSIGIGGWATAAVAAAAARSSGGGTIQHSKTMINVRRNA